ncbi:MAG: hypothetical protein ACRDT8_15060 [Micromonosporaceae bacterium]
MDDPGVGGSGDAYPEELMTLAREIKELAVKKRAEEINEDRGLENAKRSGQAGPPPGAARPGIQAGDDEYKALQDLYDWIPEAFEKFTRPNPAEFQPMIDHFSPVMSTFGPDSGGGSSPKGRRATGDTVMGRIEAVRYVSSWSGRAADTFKDFTSPFPLVVGNQREIARTLQEAMKANKAIFVASRGDVEKIANKTKTALKALDDSGGDAAGIVFSVAGAVAAVLGAVATGGTLPIVLAGVAGAAGVASTVSGAAEAPIAAHTVNDVLANLLQALTEVSGQIYDSERVIARWLDVNFEGVAAGGNKDKVVAPRPLLADSDKSNIKDRLQPPS